jgi:hypothetical protein
MRSAQTERCEEHQLAASPGRARRRSGGASRLRPSTSSESKSGGPIRRPGHGHPDGRLRLAQLAPHRLGDGRRDLVQLVRVHSTTVVGASASARISGATSSRPMAFCQLSGSMGGSARKRKSTRAGTSLQHGHPLLHHRRHAGEDPASKRSGGQSGRDGGRPFCRDRASPPGPTPPAADRPRAGRRDELVTGSSRMYTPFMWSAS